jgi:uncharacterized protein YeeX (DUF496 family)
MRPFHTIAVLHDDILEGRLTMDIFAADLWEVYQNRGPFEYKNPEIFFKKTFITRGLDNLFNVVENRLNGSGGDPVIELQTPFGGGKTHSLIGLYHKSKEWNSKVFVFVGDKLDPSETLIWEELERQLTGEVKELNGKTVPSGEKIRELLKENQPIILLLDELIEYLIPAQGIELGNTTLDTQILSFIKRLSESVKSTEKAVLISTSPSKIHFSEAEQDLLNRLKERLGRVKRSYTPVEETEIADIVTKRLFTKIYDDEAKEIVIDAVEYFKDQNILPSEEEPSNYIERFNRSFPFLPDVIDTFYHKWGTFPTFQRTRGVLRILSLIIYGLRNSNIEYISLADVDLRSQDLRRELLDHIGNEFDSIIDADITNINSGSKKVDRSLKGEYRGLEIASKSSTAVFLSSFSGGGELSLSKGSTLIEIKRLVAKPGLPSSIVSEVLDSLKQALFYLEDQGDRVLFSNVPNINKVLTDRIDNIEDEIAIELEKDYLISATKKQKLKTYIWPKEPVDVADDSELKLIIFNYKPINLINSIIETKGNSPRVYRNTMFFLIPLEEKKLELINSIKRKIALEQIDGDLTLQFTEKQKNWVKNSIKQQEKDIKSDIRETYRVILIPDKIDTNFKEQDLGIGTYGQNIDLSEEVYKDLVPDYIVENMTPLYLKKEYLKSKSYVSTKQILDTFLKTLGQPRILDRTVIEKCIEDGVNQGLFCLGELDKDVLKTIYWKEVPIVSFDEEEIIIEESLCKKEVEDGSLKVDVKPPGGEFSESQEVVLTTEKGDIYYTLNGSDPSTNGTKYVNPIRIGFDGQTILKFVVLSENSNSEVFTEIYNIDQSITTPELPTVRDELGLTLNIPKGKVSDLMGLLNFIQMKFEDLEIQIRASKGSITEEEYENRILEAIRQIKFK